MLRRERRTDLAVFCVVAGLALTYALFTNSAWEDWYITYRASKNLAIGNGLVFNPGQRVHSFTSPLGTLIPALLAWITGAGSDDRVLWLFRIASSGALGAAAVALRHCARAVPLTAAPTALVIVLMAVDAKTLEFTTSGMETGFLLLFVALTLRALLAPRTRYRAVELGIAWAGLMWTRPDGFVYAAVLSSAVWLWCPASATGSSRRSLLRDCIMAAVITVILYGPWFLWAWNYYGSPVPHPVTAKSQATGVRILAGGLLRYPGWLLTAGRLEDPLFLPANYAMGGWPPVLGALSCLEILCALYWLFPGSNRVARAISMAFLCLHAYLSAVTPRFHWYYPPVAMLGFLVIGNVVHDGRAAAARWRESRREGVASMTVRLVPMASFALLVLLAATTVAASYQLRVQQRLVEEGHRKQVGLWLRAQAQSPNDTVFLEPLGYIGFFSGLKIYDYPGLSSPEMVSAIRQVGHDWGKLIRRLDPDWLVLRPVETARIMTSDPRLLTDRYVVARTFDVSKQVADERWLPGRGYLRNDQTFVVYRRAAS